MVTFRFANEADTPLILKFIRGLARYEGLEERLQATEELLRQQLFREETAQVLFAMEKGREVGFALFFQNFSAYSGRGGLYLDALFVRPEARGRGCGRALMKQLAVIAAERGCARLEWICLDWNRPGIDLYRSLQAVPVEDCTVYRLEGDALRHLAEATE